MMRRTLRFTQSLTSRRLMSNLVIPGNQDAFNTILKSDAKAILYYTASWCPPCKAIAPIFENLSKENPNITFTKVDVDALPEAASFAGIQSVPTFLFRSEQKTISEVGVMC